ncbi:hypothetical protein ACWCPM_27365 [Streptomyces sp. NPDC002309]
MCIHHPHRVPFVVAAVNAVLGAAVVAVRRGALTAKAEQLPVRQATEDGVGVFANWPLPSGLW